MGNPTLYDLISQIKSLPQGLIAICVIILDTEVGHYLFIINTNQDEDQDEALLAVLQRVRNLYNNHSGSAIIVVPKTTSVSVNEESLKVTSHITINLW
jgi:hypothetical protein